MKMIIATVLLMASMILAADHYYFEAWVVDDSVKSQHKTTNTELPLMVDLASDTDEVLRFYRIYVTQPEYASGWDALAQPTKDAGKAAAETYSQTYTNWTTQLQAAIDALYDEINTIRTDPKLGLPAITDPEKVDKVKSKKKDPKPKKPKKDK